MYGQRFWLFFKLPLLRERHRSRFRIIAFLVMIGVQAAVLWKAVVWQNATRSGTLLQTVETSYPMLIAAYSSATFLMLLTRWVIRFLMWRFGRLLDRVQQSRIGAFIGFCHVLWLFWITKVSVLTRREFAAADSSLETAGILIGPDISEPFEAEK